MDVVIESTRSFEQDLDQLSTDKKAIAVQKINDCATLFPTQKGSVYQKLRRPLLISGLNEYESSLYTLRISKDLRVILAVDEDPIFGQAIFTLFRVVNCDEINQAYQGIAASLYQEIFSHQDREIARIS
ncbi:hypothetical protein PN441_19925 [Spirulina major CS-329]|uniref:hypothetical protein n=1 Tax=Spirulina TaxID=1154 RepID=UPI00232D3F96|nr:MULTISPECIES: hypothetical protein [Spirulina]MDB9495694.1 hypothetical protein [Spirulina subsalsa CS-330]MDB9505353.1 hypothetical protein [Spirulina major CS-329]